MASLKAIFSYRAEPVSAGVGVDDELGRDSIRQPNIVRCRQPVNDDADLSARATASITSRESGGLLFGETIQARLVIEAPADAAQLVLTD